jgi:hypothetical protein
MKTPNLMNGSPKSCWGCEKPFLIRADRKQVQLGQDGRLYCYGMTPGCLVLAVKPVMLKHAS